MRKTRFLDQQIALALQQVAHGASVAEVCRKLGINQQTYYPVFREIGSDAAFFADPHDATSLASAMEEALAFPQAREMLVKRGRRVVEQFSWDRSATQLLGLFREVLNEQDEKATGTAPAALEVPGARAGGSITPLAA